MNKGLVVWITGLSAAGKTTLARQVVNHMRGKHNQVVHLDGDQLRDIFASHNQNANQHDRDARLRLAHQYAGLCKVLSEQGIDVVISTISMFEEIFSWNRQNIKNYLEVFLDVPLNIREQRDPKGIYERFRNKQATNVAGLDLTVDIPTQSDLTFENAHEQPIENQLKSVIELINERKLA